MVKVLRKNKKNSALSQFFVNFTKQSEFLPQTLFTLSKIKFENLSLS